MSDQPDDQDGTAEDVTEQPLGAWSEPAEGSAWANIEDQAESGAPGPAGPGAPPEQPTTEVDPVTEAGHSRRPTSLRDQYVKADDPPRRKLESPAFPSPPSIPGSPVAATFPGPPSIPGSPVTPPVSEPEQAGSPDQAPDPAPSFKKKLPFKKPSVDKLPLNQLSLKKLPLDKLPLGKLPFKKPSRGKPSRETPATVKPSTDKPPADKLRTLARQRPELGVGLAFAGGLVIATILKRLGRR